MLALKKYKPFIIEAARVSGIMASGDLLAQTVIEKKLLTEIDAVRTAKFAGLGFVVVGPVLRYWYSALDRLVAPNQPPLKRVLKKVSLDQLAFAPCFSSVLICIIGKMNGDTNEQMKQRLRNDYISIMLQNYMLWPAAQLINFSVVPVQYQVIFVQIVAVFWNCLLSSTLNKKAQD